MDMFSWDTVASLPSSDIDRLKEFLPKELQCDPDESTKTLEMLFNNQLTRFDQSTLDTFFNNLQDGNYRPDIARYRKRILEAEKKEQMIKECDYLTTLVENVVKSREKLLKEAHGMNSMPKMFQNLQSISENDDYLTPATMKAKERYQSELSNVFQQLGVLPFDEELLNDKKKLPNAISKSANSDNTLKITGTMSSRGKVTKTHKVGKDRYRQMLKAFKKRKIIEPDSPEMEFGELNLSDIATRVKLITKPRKTIVKQQQQPPQQPPRESETEEEIPKFKVIKKEPEIRQKRKYTLVNRKRRNPDVKLSAAEQKKKIIAESKATLRMVCESLENTTNYPSSDASEELTQRNRRYVCFFSLIRDIFCSTTDHRMKLEDFRREVKTWSESATASLNNWFASVDDWNAVVLSSVQFLSGDFKSLPSDFVPYLEFKSQLNMYQWIGAGRDSDTRMSALSDFWIMHRNDGTIKKPPMKFKVFDKTIKNPEINVENHLRSPISQPNARCRSEWKVVPVTVDAMNEFAPQEKRRFERPQSSFIYHQHGYYSIVGPIDVNRMNSTPIQKMKDNSFLTHQRPYCVTLGNLVRDAAARLPNGEGTRSDISKLVKYSQYLLPNLSDSVVETIVSEILDKVHKEEDCFLKYDTKRSLWIYLHRNRTEKDFETIERMRKSKMVTIPASSLTRANESDVSISTAADKTPSPIVKIPAKKIFKISKMPDSSSGSFDVEESIPGAVTKKIQRVPVTKKVNTIISHNQKFEIKITNPQQDSKFVRQPQQHTPVEDHKPNLIKISEASGTVIKPQQKIILTSSSLQKQGKLMTIMKNDTMMPMLSQQKQILTNVIVQQQKAKTPNQVILTNVNHQKMPTITISPKNIRPTSIVQLPQTSTTTIASKQMQTGKIMHPISVQTIKSSPMTIEKSPSNFSANIISAVKGKPAVTFKPEMSTNATIKTTTGNVFQISHPQFTMMTKGKVIQLPSNSHIITSSSSETGTSIITTDQQPKSQLKFVQSGSIPQQRFVGAKFLNVAGLTGRTVQTTTGVK